MGIDGERVLTEYPLLPLLILMDNAAADGEEFEARMERQRNSRKKPTGWSSR